MRFHKSVLLPPQPVSEHQVWGLYRRLAMTASKLKRAARVILVGAPGVGKGTQAERLMKRFPQLSAVSSGDLLREGVRNKTPLGEDSCLYVNETPQY